MTRDELHAITVGGLKGGNATSPYVLKERNERWQMWGWCPEHDQHYYWNEAIIGSRDADTLVGCVSCMGA